MTMQNPKLKTGKIVAVSISEKKGTKKINMSKAQLKEGFGIIGDGHAGTKNRQISLLALESIDKMRDKGIDVSPGEFAENITTQGIELPELPMETKLRIGKDVFLEITQIGKDCQQRCSIYYQIGDCVMPREGIFAKVIKGGIIKPGDQIIVC